MKNDILNYIIEQFGEKTDISQRKNHYSYCKFPEEDCCCKDLNEISYDTSLISGGYIDSFSMVAVLVYIENKFDVKIPDKEAIPSNFDTVNKIVELINKFKK